MKIKGEESPTLSSILSCASSRPQYHLPVLGHYDGFYKHPANIKCHLRVLSNIRFHALLYDALRFKIAKARIKKIIHETQVPEMSIKG